MEFAKKEAEQLSQLEDALEKAHSQEQMYVEAMDNLQAEYDVLEQENIQLKKEATKKEEKRQSLLKKINYDDVSSSTATDITDEIPGGYQMMDSHVSHLYVRLYYMMSLIKASFFIFFIFFFTGGSYAMANRCKHSRQPFDTCAAKMPN